MKKIKYQVYGMIILSLLGFSCNKILGKTCWECTVTRFGNTGTYHEKVCNDGTYPEFHDDRGNDLQSVCEKK